MKKKIIKFFSICCLLMAVGLSMSIKNDKNEFLLFVENFNVLAYADDEQGWEPYCDCVNYVSSCYYNGIEAVYMKNKE